MTLCTRLYFFSITPDQATYNYLAKKKKKKGKIYNEDIVKENAALFFCGLQPSTPLDMAGNY